MYCPRCGSPNTETTKFCRQCGLPMTEVSGYVASGGTGALITPPTVQHPAPPFVQTPMPMMPMVEETSEMLALKHRRTMMILAFVFVPIVLAIIGDSYLHLGDIVGVPFVLMPMGIIWTTFRYKFKMRQLQEEQMRQQLTHSQPLMHPQMQPPLRPAFQPQSYQKPAATPVISPPTNRFNEPVPGSVIEDETRRF